MSTILVIFTIWLMHLGVTMTPGPAFLVVAQASMAEGKKSGVATAIGLGVGTMTVAAVGLMSSGYLLQLHAESLWFLKLISGSYLAWIGFRMWVTSGKKIAIDETLQSPKSQLASFFNGLLVNVFNPKVILLFLSLFTTVLLPETPIWAKCVVLALVSLNAAAWYTIVAIFLSAPLMQRSYMQCKKLLDRIFGTALFGSGIWLTQQA